MRFHGDTISRAEVLEPQGCHRSDEGGRRSLMATNLDAVVVGSVTVCGVDHPNREPKNSLCDVVQQLDIHGSEFSNLPAHD
jgi:hypothetical protein